MSTPSILPQLFLFAGIGLILLADWALLAWTLRLSHRIQKLEIPPQDQVDLVALLQVLAGVAVTLLLRWLQTGPALALGSGVVLMLLAGFPLIIWLLKVQWKASLLTWALAGGMALFFVPLVSAVMTAILILTASVLFPPQFQAFR